MSKQKKEEQTSNPEAPASNPCPIYSRIIGYVAEKVGMTPDSKKAILDSITGVVAEFDAFIRNGNRTDYRRDGEAFQSAKVEPWMENGALVEGKHAFTYSTMKDRRVDDIIFAALMHASSYVFPPQARTDTKKDGTPKMSSREAERLRWIASLGFQKVEAGKGKRTLFGDVFAELKAELENTIPERFIGTEAPKTAKQLLALVESARRSSEISRVNVYKPEAGDEKVTLSVNVVTSYILDGCTFQQDDKGNVQGDLAQFYAERVYAKLQQIAEAEAAKKGEQAQEAAA